MIEDRVQWMPWYQAPRPDPMHRCMPWTALRLGEVFVERCACGGIRVAAGEWLERNSRQLKW